MIAIEYVPDQNPDRQSFAGVPLANLTKERFEGLPAYVRAAIVAAPFYRVASGYTPPGAASSVEAADRTHRRSKRLELKEAAAAEVAAPSVTEE